VKPGRARSLADEIAGHLRALLSDVVGGHLDADLAGLADQLLQVPDENTPEVVDGPLAEPGEDVSNTAQERKECPGEVSQPVAV
jgi:hypothetical protein